MKCALVPVLMLLGNANDVENSAESYDGVIHHLSYPAGCHKRNVEDLLREKICQWLCRTCHDAIHITESWEEAEKDKMKRGAHCAICGELTFGGLGPCANFGDQVCRLQKMYAATKA